MTVPRLRLALLFVATALAANAAVPVDPNNARGFADKVFHLGDLDSINTFNGNLVVRLPIGGTYTTGPNLGDSLVLTNNSRVWGKRAVTPRESKRRSVSTRWGVPLRSDLPAKAGRATSTAHPQRRKPEWRLRSGHSERYPRAIRRVALRRTTPSISMVSAA